jgi:hypothetical protein
MNVVVSLVFRVLCFLHQGKIVTIDHLVFFTPDLGSNVGSIVPFVGNHTQSYMNVDVGMLKHPSLMGIFTLPLPSPTTSITPINMISSFTNGSLECFDPWLVPCPENVESFGASKPPIAVDIIDPTIPSTSTDNSSYLHPHMECDQPTPLVEVV